MEIRRKETGQYNFPFSELINGNHFVFSNNIEKTYVKTGKDNYRDESDNLFFVSNHVLHSTNVRLINYEQNKI